VRKLTSALHGAKNGYGGRLDEQGPGDRSARSRLDVSDGKLTVKKPLGGM
jgi:hypothetical protein